MKAMLLAAGRGERMRPLTDQTPKPLLSVNGTSLIDYHLINLARAGITDVVINTCWLASRIIDHIGNGDKFNLRVSYSHEQQALETAGGVANAMHLLGDEPFLLISSDIWCDVNIESLKPLTLQHQAHLILVDNPAHHQQGDFSLEQGKVSLDCTQGTLTYSGIGIFHPSMFHRAHEQTMALRQVLLPAIQNEKVSGQHYRGMWMDVGTPHRLSQLDSLLKQQNGSANH